MTIVYLPRAYNIFLPILCIKRLAKTFDGFIDLVDIGVRDLEGLGIAVNGPYGVLHHLSAGLQPDERALDLFGEEIELIEVGIQHLYLCALLCERRIPGGNHGRRVRSPRD